MVICGGTGGPADFGAEQAAILADRDGSCLTSDCGFSEVEYNGAGAALPVILVDFTLELVAKIFVT